MRAKIFCTAVDVACPKCNAPIPDPVQDSLYWTLEEIEARAGTTVECGECGAHVQLHLPKRVPISAD